MWTDEMWNLMVKTYPLGTKQRLVFDLAGYTGNDAATCTAWGWDQFIPPSDGLPYGSLRVEQEKGDDDDGEPYVAHIRFSTSFTRAWKPHESQAFSGRSSSFGSTTRTSLTSKEASGTPSANGSTKRASRTGYSLHGLRKLCVCRLIERGCDPTT
jgi:hypothetical protein